MCSIAGDGQRDDNLKAVPHGRGVESGIGDESAGCACPPVEGGSMRRHMAPKRRPRPQWHIIEGRCEPHVRRRTPAADSDQRRGIVIVPDQTSDGRQRHSLLTIRRVALGLCGVLFVVTGVAVAMGEPSPSSGYPVDVVRAGLLHSPQLWGGRVVRVRGWERGGGAMGCVSPVEKTCAIRWIVVSSAPVQDGASLRLELRPDHDDPFDHSPLVLVQSIFFYLPIVGPRLFSTAGSVTLQVQLYGSLPCPDTADDPGCLDGRVFSS